jgi:hypothetical protein
LCSDSIDEYIRVIEKSSGVICNACLQVDQYCCFLSDDKQMVEAKRKLEESRGIESENEKQLISKFMT